MFTGIIESVGEIAEIQAAGADYRLNIATGRLDLADLKLGDSVAVNGICLTVTQLTGRGFWADVSAETVACSTFANLKGGDRVNLEKALTPTSRLGGHLVSGHVDGVGEVVSKEAVGGSIKLTIKAPEGLARYIAEKGSITISGISLTVNRVEGVQFELNIVPHTQGETTLTDFKPGTAVNIEVDQIARYLERLFQGDTGIAAKPGITESFLAQHGFK
ncbi:MAG: riboflavin synthase [Gammaproteobacteria bacterium]|nr:riboflavin synthase [Gammaproteobacteria bacterium]